MSKQNNLPVVCTDNTSHHTRKKRGNHNNLPATRNTRSYPHKPESLPPAQAEQLVKQIEERLLKSLEDYKRIEPPTWTRPASSCNEGDGRSIEVAKKLITELKVWSNILPRDIGSPLWDALDDLNGLLITGWTEVDEALLHISVGTNYLRRWMGRKGRVGNAG
ncbi:MULTISPECIES: hypothetical protein [Nitrosomonas]|uniref:Uncharacterized protein n=1 Tax=Nitrosomonas communis TaxID=44574 RepID=A0A0F7KH78_9PROT|nr:MULTISPECIES: hypothetical protein [Nitrosomonas]AKH38214.1 hypothetical protein AAW31_11125 [Nitrosomonas communis]TYP77440.1 hypothetical protein BCL69_107915 [Nitrosomonas communis]UVS60188.1 hypothetical protein NX761_11755 [Nitrosomonas sp. PLL12]